MKLSTTLLSTFIAIVLFTSCGDGKKKADAEASEKAANERQTLMDEVLEIHDEVMPKMGDLRKAKKGLEALADSLKQTGAALEAVPDLMARATELEVANEAMMGWMRQFNPDVMSDTIPQEEAMSYLRGQMDMITEVRDQMNQALVSGQDALK